ITSRWCGENCWNSPLWPSSPLSTARRYAFPCGRLHVGRLAGVVLQDDAALRALVRALLAALQDDSPLGALVGRLVLRRGGRLVRDGRDLLCFFLVLRIG